MNQKILVEILFPRLHIVLCLEEKRGQTFPQPPSPLHLTSSLHGGVWSVCSSCIFCQQDMTQPSTSNLTKLDLSEILLCEFQIGKPAFFLTHFLLPVNEAWEIYSSCNRRDHFPSGIFLASIQKQNKRCNRKHLPFSYCSHSYSIVIFYTVKNLRVGRQTDFILISAGFFIPERRGCGILTSLAGEKASECFCGCFQDIHRSCSHILQL